MRAKIAVAVVCAGLVLSFANAEEKTDEASRTAIERTRDLFPATRNWFRLVETLAFVRAADGGFAPDYRTLTHPRVRHADGAGRSLLPTFPPRFGSPMRIQSVGDADAYVDVVPIDAEDVRLQIIDGLAVYDRAYRDTVVIYKATPTHTDEYLLLETPSAQRRWSFRLIPGRRIASIRRAGNGIEARDADGAAILRAAPPFAIDRSGRRVDGTVRLTGDVLEMSIDLDGMELPVLVDPDWSSTGDMAYGRFYHGTNVLPDGRVLATGGCSASICSGNLTIPACRAIVGEAEALSLRTRTFSRVGSGVPRFFHVSESLADGDVLVAGGCGDPTCDVVLASVETYVAASEGFRTVTGGLAEARAGIASALLADGRVLLAGGCTLTGCSTRAEVYDPASDSIVAVAPMNVARGRATVAPLRDGRVLVAGGCTSIDCDGVVADAEVYVPSEDRWVVAGSLGVPRAGHFTAARYDGTVVVGGGCADPTCATVHASTEVFDPSLLAFASGPALQRPRFGAVAARLPDGAIMVSQGCASSADCDLTNEVIDTDATSSAVIEPAVTQRAFHTLVVHPSYRLAIANGGCQPGTCSWWVETYDVSDRPPPPDAGFPPFPDGGPFADAGRDAGADAASPTRSGGCDCRVGALGARAPNGALLVGLALVAARARRRSRSRSSFSVEAPRV